MTETQTACSIGPVPIWTVPGCPVPIWTVPGCPILNFPYARGVSQKAQTDSESEWGRNRRGFYMKGAANKELTCVAF